MAGTVSALKSKALASTRRTRRRAIATIKTSTSLETEPHHAIPSTQQSWSPDSHVSGSSLGTRSFSLATLIEELESVDSEIWGTDPMNPDELSDDPDDNEVQLNEEGAGRDHILNATSPPTIGHKTGR